VAAALLKRASSADSVPGAGVDAVPVAVHVAASCTGAELAAMCMYVLVVVLVLLGVSGMSNAARHFAAP